MGLFECEGTTLVGRHIVGWAVRRMGDDQAVATMVWTADGETPTEFGGDHSMALKRAVNGLLDTDIRAELERLRSERDRAVSLLHMIDRVAEFLDALEREEHGGVL